MWEIIAIIVIIIAIIIFLVARHSCENFSAIGEFVLHSNKDSPAFADLRHVPISATSLASRHDQLANECYRDPLCVAFTSTGYLKSGILPSLRTFDYRSAIAGCTPDVCGLYTMRGIVPEPLYAELFIDQDYGPPRLLLPPGQYADIGLAHQSGGAKGYQIPNDKLSSLRVPVGLKITLFKDKNFKGDKIMFGYGNYPNLKLQKWGDTASSVIVEYDT